MNFIGIDLAWGNRNPTGLAHLVSDGPGCRLVRAERLTTDEEILEWVEACGGDDVWLGIDAPIIARNPPGTSRPADKMVSARFARYHAGVYPANRVRCERPIRLCRKLRRRGFSSNPWLPGRGGRRQLEIFPHLVQVAFFERPRIIKYKKGPVQARQAGLAEFQAAIETHLARQDPPLLPSPELAGLLSDDPRALRGSALKSLEDRLDALLCAYMALYFHAWGRTRCEVIGDHAEGYIIGFRVP